MLVMWDKEKNLNVHQKLFKDINCKDDTFEAYWICYFEDRLCSFTKSPKKMYHSLYSGSIICPLCNEIPFEKSIAFNASYQISNFWNEEKNAKNNVFPQYISTSSNKMVFVKCDKHDWGIKEDKLQRCADLAKHIPCPKCNGKEASSEYNLQLYFPKIAEELHPSFNPKSILPFSKKVYPWWCNDCGKYFDMAVSTRTSQFQSCPNHNGKSTTEELIRALLNVIVGGFEKYSLPDMKWSSNGSPVEIDLYNSANFIAIEFDGYHHIERQFPDQEKNIMFRDHEDVKLFIRIRERGLPKLEYFYNQYEVICGKHESSYNFLISPIQKILRIIKQNTTHLKIKEYSHAELKILIRKLLPHIEGSNATKRGRIPFGLYAPGLLKYLVEDKRNPNKYSYGSNVQFKVKCPYCGHNFSPHKSKLKNLIKSKGFCNNCLLFVENINILVSSLVKWHPKKNRLKP